MKQVEFGSGKILLTKYKGVLSAVSGKCTHYGAPLVTGAFKDGKVRCPWHGACFNTVTGDIEDFPGLDSLHKYEVCTYFHIFIFYARLQKVVSHYSVIILFLCFVF